MQSPSVVLMSQLDALTRGLDVVANNVANQNTTGFKRQQMLFETFISRPAPKEQFDLVYDRATYRDTAGGPIVQTGNTFDVALQGPGYFSIETPQGLRYSRNGSFTLNSEGELVTLSGNRVLNNGGSPIQIPSDSGEVTIAKDGSISTEAGQVGRLGVFRFANEQLLREEAGGLYIAETAATPDTGETTSIQGALERSNVNPIAEMTRMTEITRAYQRVQRLIETEHERIRTALRQLGRPV